MAPSWLSWTVQPSTAVRPNPTSRLATVSTAISVAAPASRAAPGPVAGRGPTRLTAPRHPSILDFVGWKYPARPTKSADKLQDRCEGARARRSGSAPAELVQPAQPAGALDHGGEADPLAGGRQPGHDGEDGGPPDRPGTR